MSVTGISPELVGPIAMRTIRALRQNIALGLEPANPAALRLLLPPNAVAATATFDAASLTSSFTAGTYDTVSWTDARLRWPSIQPIVAGATFPDTAYGKFDAAPLSSGQLEFVFDGDELEMVHKGLGPSAYYHLWIDGFPLSYTTPQGSDLPADGATYYSRIVFPDKRPRFLRFIMYGTKYIAGFRHGKDDTIYESPTDLSGPLLGYAGDSFSESGPGGPGTSWGEFMGRCLGLNRYFGTGSGGTGFLTTNGARVKLRDRLYDDLLRYNPDIIVIAMGINDQGAWTYAELLAEIQEVIRLIRLHCPHALVFFIGPWAPRASPGAGWTTVTNAIKDAMTAMGMSTDLFFIDTLATPAWITGNGKVGSENGSGNSDRYTRSDATHPTVDGSLHLGYRTASNIVKKYELIRASSLALAA